VRLSSTYVLGLMALAAAALHSQPAPGAVYYSAAAPDCSSLAGESPVTITDATGKPLGYSCYVSGTFVWLAAGGGWRSSIRVAAPGSAPVGVSYSFYDAVGNSQKLDVASSAAPAVSPSTVSTASADHINFALRPNQPASLDMLGATKDSPRYDSTATGSVYVVVYCPDAVTCGNVLPQLLYSALPGASWTLSAPIAWDTDLWTGWSAEGIDDSIDDAGQHLVSLAIYNEDIFTTSYTVRVYDSTGSLVGTGMTPPIPPLQSLGNGALGEGGTYAALLRDIIPARLPSGLFKVVIDGGSIYCAAEILQFDGPSATTLQLAYDNAPALSAKSAVRRPNLRAARVESMPKLLFPPW
jgi:hypothetical protein